MGDRARDEGGGWRIGVVALALMAAVARPWDTGSQGGPEPEPLPPLDLGELNGHADRTGLPRLEALPEWIEHPPGSRPADAAPPRAAVDP